MQMLVLARYLGEIADNSKIFSTKLVKSGGPKVLYRKHC